MRCMVPVDRSIFAVQNSVAVMATGTSGGVVLKGGLTFDAVFPKIWLGGLFSTVTTAYWPLAEIRPPPSLPGTGVIVRLFPVSVDRAAIGAPAAAPRLTPNTFHVPPTLLVTVEGLTEPSDVIVGCATATVAALNKLAATSRVRREDIDAPPEK